MNHLKTHITAAFENAPSVSYRDANINALLQELHSTINNPHSTHAVGVHVLEMLSAHLKSSLLAEKAVTVARGR